MMMFVVVSGNQVEIFDQSFVGNNLILKKKTLCNSIFF